MVSRLSTIQRKRASMYAGRIRAPRVALKRMQLAENKLAAAAKTCRSSQLACKLQVTSLTSRKLPVGAKSKRRSGCPVSVSLEIFGDRWSLLIVRDMMIRGFCTFKDFQNSGEGIATNILSGRLRRLQAAGIIRAEAEQTDGRRINYRLTEKGIDLAPALLELLIWGARHQETGAPCAMVDQLARHREALLTEVRRRWQQRDPTPLQAKTGEWLWPPK
jgi:DNA-binding HxlR family transcriptional regulator